MANSGDRDFPYIRAVGGKLFLLFMLTQHKAQTDVARAVDRKDSTISPHKQALEELLGFEFFNDRGLSDEAKKLGERLGPILLDLEVTLSRRDTVTHIGITHFAARNFLPDILSVTKNFKVRIRLIEDTVDALARQLKMGALDLLVGGVPVDQDLDDGGKATRLPYALVAHPQFRVDHKSLLEAYGSSSVKFWSQSRNFSWVVNGKGTVTRRLLREKWGTGTRQALDRAIAEAADERVLLDIVRSELNSICLLPLGPTSFEWVNRSDGTPYQWHVLVAEDLPSVRVGASSIRSPNAAILAIREAINAKIAQSMGVMNSDIFAAMKSANRQSRRRPSGHSSGAV